MDRRYGSLIEVRHSASSREARYPSSLREVRRSSIPERPAPSSGETPSSLRPQEMRTTSSRDALRPFPTERRISPNSRETRRPSVPERDESLRAQETHTVPLSLRRALSLRPQELRTISPSSRDAPSLRPGEWRVPPCSRDAHHPSAPKGGAPCLHPRETCAVPPLPERSSPGSVKKGGALSPIPERGAPSPSPKRDSAVPPCPTDPEDGCVPPRPGGRNAAPSVPRGMASAPSPRDDRRPPSPRRRCPVRSEGKRAPLPPRQREGPVESSIPERGDRRRRPRTRGWDRRARAPVQGRGFQPRRAGRRPPTRLPSLRRRISVRLPSLD